MHSLTTVKVSKFIAILLHTSGQLSEAGQEYFMLGCIGCRGGI